jgi:cytochrome P450
VHFHMLLFLDIMILHKLTILEYLPLKALREAWHGWKNWDQYMHELMEQKILEARADAESEGLDIMGSLVRRAARDMDLGKLTPKSPSQIEAASKSVFSKTDILGNTFVMILAGHETTANSIHFSLMELAMAPNSQSRLQKEVDTILGESDPAAWDYESNINALLGGMAGAVLNEELRLMPPVVNIPKCVHRAQPQTITIDGKKFTLPADSLVNLNAVGLQVNPRYWPSTGPSKVSKRKDDLYDFVPERWLRGERSGDGSLSPTSPTSHEMHTATEPANGEDEDFGGFTGSASAAQLFRPVRGSYIPFSEGGRSCLGRRLAQVEVMAVLSVIFQKYSVELAVDEWASDEDVEGMSDGEKRAVYAKAVEKAREIIRGASSLISLKLHKDPGFVPVRLVRRGSERFLNILE